ncbi:MAG: RDD family protein [Gammaproteobacteria bacterium]
MLDSRRAIETPEGVEIQLRVAGPFVRGLAALLDILIMISIATALGQFLVFFGTIGYAFLSIIMFILYWFYPVLSEIYMQGATFGKKALNIKVLHDDGTEVSWQASIIRNILRYVDFLPFGYCFGFLSIICNSDFKRLGDFTAGTLVVYTDKEIKNDDIPQKSPLMPRWSLKTDEQLAIMDFAERLKMLSPQRQNELSDILSELTGKKSEQGTIELIQYANWIVGRR